MKINNNENLGAMLHLREACGVVQLLALSPYDINKRKELKSMGIYIQEYIYIHECINYKS